MESLDWTKLAGDITQDTKRIPYGPNKHLFHKVAFDVFQLNSSPIESLWTLEDDDDGTQYLVAQYSDDEKSHSIEVTSSWEALSDKSGKNVTLLYKDTPIQRFASADYGFDGDDVHLFQQSLVKLLNSNPNFVAKVLRGQSKERLGILAQHYPELRALDAELEEGPTEWEEKNDPYFYDRKRYEDDLRKSFEDESTSKLPDDKALYIIDKLYNTIKDAMSEKGIELSHGDLKSIWDDIEHRMASDRMLSDVK